MALLTIALDHVTLGRAYLAGGELETAGEYLRKAVDGLRASGQMDTPTRPATPRKLPPLAEGRLRRRAARPGRSAHPDPPSRPEALRGRHGARSVPAIAGDGRQEAARQQLTRAQEGIEAMGYYRHREAAEELAAQIQG